MLYFIIPYTGYYCPASTVLVPTTQPVPCSVGTFGEREGLSHQDNCTICLAGKYCNGEGRKTFEDFLNMMVYISRLWQQMRREMYYSEHIYSTIYIYIYIYIYIHTYIHRVISLLIFSYHNVHSVK